MNSRAARRMGRAHDADGPRRTGGRAVEIVQIARGS